MNRVGVPGRQLPLGFYRNEAASFENFVAGPNIDTAVEFAAADGGRVDVDPLTLGDQTITITDRPDLTGRHAASR